MPSPSAKTTNATESGATTLRIVMMGSFIGGVAVTLVAVRLTGSPE